MTAGLQSNSLSNRSVRGEKLLLFKNNLIILLFSLILGFLRIWEIWLWSSCMGLEGSPSQFHLEYVISVCKVLPDAS